MALTEQPSLTDIYDHASTFVPRPGSAYVFMRSPEERSEHIDSWRAKAEDVTFVEVTEKSAFEIAVTIAGKTLAVMLRSDESLADFWQKIDSEAIYIDMT